MRKLNKKLVLSIVALVMISTLGIGKALGYFTTHTNATGGYKMDLGFTDTKIEEDVDKDGKHVVITNVGDYDCFVRIKVFAADNLMYQSCIFKPFYGKLKIFGSSAFLYHAVDEFSVFF